MKSVGELLAIGVRFLIVKTDTIVLKRAQRPGTVKVKAFVMSCTLICFLHVILATVSTTSIEDWSFLESLYAWFTTFTTIGFGDYIHLETFTRKTAHGDMGYGNGLMIQVDCHREYINHSF